jgi:UDP-N-acetylmuramoylalanine--D-glutamate ligase
MKIRNAAVVGFGKTGKALLNFLLERNICDGVFLYNDAPIEDVEDYRRRGVIFLTGVEEFPRLLEMDIVIMSPGVNGRDERFADIRKKNIPILSEIEFASRFIGNKIIAVTGTNGKSTTVSLIHHILTECGVNSVLAGNIGNPFIAEIQNVEADSVVVLELSSFQLEEIIEFKPHIALLLNVTPDHLDRYPGIGEYFAAKLEIFKNQDDSDFRILNFNDSLLREHSNIPGRASHCWFSLHQEVEPGAYIDGGNIVLNLDGGKESVSLADNPLEGIHNKENLLAAVLAAKLLGLDAQLIEKSFANFKGLPHRMEAADTIEGISFINDSKATNVDATLKSVNSFSGNLVLMLGGKDKGGDFTLLEESIKERVYKVLLIGHAAETIARQLTGVGERCEFVRDFPEAVRKGFMLLKEGPGSGTVLLAPGCASFDMFRSFEHRGDVFKEAVAEFKNEKGG